MYDVGDIDGIHYLTMAYIEGRSLAEVLRGNKKPVQPRQAAALVRKLALALEEAHHKKVIHRDLKPANIMLGKRGEPIIMDFGLARRGNTQDARLTQQGSVMGTPAYMAPEQAKGNIDEMGPGCDIYSLGVILYELLTGRLPFTGDMVAILTKLLTDPPTPPSRHRPDLDAKIESICLKAMAKKPAGRFGSMADFAAALTEYLKNTDQTVMEGAKTLPPAAELPFAETNSQALPTISAPPRKGCGAIGPALAAVVLLLGAGAVLYSLRDKLALPTAPVVDDRKPDGSQVKADELVACTWPAAALREGKIAAPDLSKVKPVFQDEFNDPTSGFPRGKGQGFRGPHGYRNGKYYIEMPGRGSYYWIAPLRRVLDRVKPAIRLDDFACRLVGQATGTKARWGLCFLERETEGEQQRRLIIAISNSGLLHVTSGSINKPIQEPVAHSAIKKGEKVFNMLLVVLRGRQLELYVNGVAVCDPLLLERAIPSARLALDCNSTSSQGSSAEFDDIIVWPADSIPSLESRGAVPKR